MNQFFTGDAATFWPAFAKAQAAFPKLTFDKAVSAGAKQYKYATLPAVFEAVRDTLNAAGFAVFHLIEGTGVKAVIAGNGGMLESGLCDLGTPNITAQVAGSAITYARRYTLTALCGIAPEEDDDAQGANAHPVNAAPKATPPPVARPAAPQKTVIASPDEVLAKPGATITESTKQAGMWKFEWPDAVAGVTTDIKLMYEAKYVASNSPTPAAQYLHDNQENLWK
jgi:hypothetical protein